MEVKELLIRALKTFAQTAAAIIGTNTAGIISVDWLNVLSISSLAFILSILTNFSQISLRGASASNSEKEIDAPSEEDAIDFSEKSDSAESFYGEDKND